MTLGSTVTPVRPLRRTAPDRELLAIPCGQAEPDRAVRLSRPRHPVRGVPVADHTGNCIGPLVHPTAHQAVRVMTTSTPDHFRRVLGHFPTGVTVITAMGADGAPVGMSVGSFSSVSLDPQLIAFYPDR